MSKPDKIKISGSKLSELCQRMGYCSLTIEDRHIMALETLVYHNQYQPHNDPFDRIMIAQAKADGLIFLTCDSKMPYYEEECIMIV